MRRTAASQERAGPVNKHLGEKGPERDGGREDVIVFFGEATLGVVEGFLNIVFGQNFDEWQSFGKLKGFSYCGKLDIIVRRHEDRPWLVF